MTHLPITSAIPELLTAIQSAPQVILQAPPGAGKTTAVPLALIDRNSSNADRLGEGRIVMLEPRRLAARSSAARMAELLGEPVGQTVGYQVRSDRKASKDTRILVVTEGILTRMLQDDPELTGINLVIFDEFHERSLQADLSLALCLQSQSALREDLKLLVMSATLNTEALCHLLPDAPVVSSEGRSYPVAVQFWPERQPKPDRFNLISHLQGVTRKAWEENDGNILIFLPGVGEIKQLEQALLDAGYADTLITPLYGELGKQQQDQAISSPPAGQRKIVLATNIAETSITIDGITVVIDSGLMRESQFDPNSGMNRLVTKMISRDSAKQRAGRAGRLAPGVCYRLWPESQHRQLQQHHTPEILSSDLAPLVLEAANWGAQSLDEFDWIDAPPPGHVAQAIDLLQQLGAIDLPLRITPHGKAMLSMGLHPRLAHMLLSSLELGGSDSACLLAAMLSERDILKSRERNADMLLRLEILKGQQKHPATNLVAHGSLPSATLEHPCSSSALHLIKQQARELQRKLKQSNTQTINPAILLAQAYPERIAQLRNARDRRYLLASGKGAALHTNDALPNEEYLVITSLDGRQREAAIFTAAAISKAELEEHFDHLITDHSEVSWDSKNQRVLARQERRLGAICLDSQDINNPSREQIQQALLAGIREQGLDCLPWSKEALALRARIHFINRLKADDRYTDHLAIELPAVDDEHLLNSLEKWLLPHLSNENSLSKLKHLNLHTILLSQINWNEQQQLDQLAPSHFNVPSGSRIAINYEEEIPVLAVRLQEMFGLQQTPSILNGQFPLLIHLLSPAHRPMQITQDLMSFWHNTYQDVKKELKIKYKKHYWPDNPLEAQATSKTKKNMHKA